MPMNATAWKRIRESRMCLMSVSYLLGVCLGLGRLRAVVLRVAWSFPQ